MATKRDDFFDPFVSFRREMDHMFDRFFDGLPASTGTAWQALTPAVDVDETDKEMVITAELPGVSDKDVEDSLIGDVLTIKGEKKSEKEQRTAIPPMSSAASDPSRDRCACRSR